MGTRPPAGAGGQGAAAPEKTFGCISNIVVSRKVSIQGVVLIAILVKAGGGP